MFTYGPPAWIEWRGRRYFRQRGGHYADSGSGLLHRHVWIAEYGDIPAGHDIHHIDEDKTNNEPSNLTPLTKGGHSALTQRSLATRGEHPFQQETPAERSEWASKRAAKKWAEAEPKQWACTVCGGSFASRATRALYCSEPCRADARRQRHAQPPSPGLRPDR